MNDERPTHLDLFSGIGGFALAAQWAGFRTIAFVERESFCQKILAQHWPNVPIYSDICQFGGRPYAGVDLLTGGFPCQPFSVAGEQRGKADDRYLWPEMLRVIQTVKPRWVIGENVAGLDGLALDDCISDLESLGYEVAPPFEIPACGIGAYHERNRLWIIANCEGLPLEKSEVVCSPRALPEFGESTFRLSEYLWKPCRETYLSEMVGVVYGVSEWVDRSKSLGNAIVPQVAFQIIKEIRKLI
jgi:DNA (cytosine-5)-methyltransferase 1